MPARLKSVSPHFKSHEITVHFKEIKASSHEVVIAAKRLGIKLGLTSRQLDALRRQEEPLRTWLSKHPDRHETFLRNPTVVLDLVKGKTPSRTLGRASKTVPRWSAVNHSGDVAVAGMEVRRWALAEPGRLTRFLKDPAGAIDAALSHHTPAHRKRVVATLDPQTKRSVKPQKNKP